MPNFKRPPDFHLDCACFLHVQKGARAMGMDIVGLEMYSDKAGNSGLFIQILKRLINPDGSRQKGMMPFNFCPFCGKQIAMKLVKGESDEKSTESK